MKIGDKVRFLNEIGDGKITGFQGKNIVLVEDGDGFEIPMQANEVVVISSDDYSTANELKKPQTQHHDGESVKHMLLDSEDDYEQEDTDPADKEITFKAPAEERKGGNKLSAFLAFVPMDSRKISTSNFECYLVNDSNYYLRYSFLVAENNSWSLLFDGELEPNTKTFVKEIERNELNDMQHVAIQMLPYKKEKPFMLKPAIDVQLRIDPVKFYKLHSFVANDYFEQPALIYTIVENDEKPCSLTVDPKSLKKEMYASPKSEGQAVKGPVRKNNPDIVVVDLHASEVLETTAGMSNADILKYQIKVFTDTLAEYAGKKGQKIVFIHGKGEGVLRNAIIKELNYKYKRYQYQDASFREYGFGATQVTIR
jgi:hypothetical protein